MGRILGEHFEDDTRVTWVDDGDAVGVHYSQDVEPVIDKIAAANAEGGKTNEGIGRPKYEVPVTIAMAYCEKRGIPWEKFLYSNEYDAEWPKLAAEHNKLVYEYGKLHTVLK